jgi:hypothetical protein
MMHRPIEIGVMCQGIQIHQINLDTCPHFQISEIARRALAGRSCALRRFGGFAEFSGATLDS